MKNKFVCIVALTLPLSSNAAQIVSDPMSYTYMANQLKDSAEQVTNQTKMLTNDAKALTTQSEIFMTSKDIYTTAKETYGVTKDAYDAVVGVYETPSDLQSRAERELERAERQPIKYVDRVFKKYGIEKSKASDPTFRFDTLEMEGEIEKEIINTYGAGSGFYRNAARNQARDEVNREAITRAQLIQQQILTGIGNPSLKASYVRLSEQIRVNTTPSERDKTRNEILLLQADIALKQLELQTRYVEAFAAMNYQAYQKTHSDEDIKNSTEVDRVDYNEILEHKLGGH